MAHHGDKVLARGNGAARDIDSRQELPPESKICLMVIAVFPSVVMCMKIQIQGR
jgi:hypothetical protein